MSTFIEQINDNKDFHKFCIILADGTKVYRFVQECEGCDDSQYFTDELGSKIVEPDLTDAKECGQTTVECVESQSWSYGIDNTGTRFSWSDTTYEMTLSDGSILEWEQTTASNGGWTAQLNEWATNIQAAADAAGLDWTVEPRFIDNNNLSDLSGNYNNGNTASGLPGVPSEVIANFMDANGISWRFVFIEICPGQPVPTNAIVKDSQDDPSKNGFTLIATPALLSPINKFFVCRSCGEEPVWYLEDGVTEAESGQIPNCFEPCGTLALVAPPPDRDCEFFFDLGCDNLSQTDPNNFVQQITRRATVCNGEQIAVDYFTEDPTDSSALVDYTLIGDFVDCDSGEVISLPQADILINCDGDRINEEHDSKVQIQGAKNPIPVFITETCDDKIEVDYELVCNEDTNLYDLYTIVTTNGVAAPATITATSTPCDEDPDFEERTVCDPITNTLHSLFLEVDEDGSFVTLSDIDLLTPCEPKQVECVESQEWTYAIDNTGTQTNEDATLTIALSDGTEIVINQTNQGATSQWTPQMQEWGDNIQAAADDAGLAWFVETRCILGPTNPSGCGGFSGPPSEVVGQALWAGNIRARYVNIQICPGQPVPVSAVYNSASRPNLQMTTAGAVLGPLQKFFVCRSCGTEPVWYLEDGVTLATSGQIPNCWEPCGTLTLTESPPDRECYFIYDLGCDNLNQNEPSNFIQQVTRRSTICTGEDIVVNYFIEDPNDSSALIDYTLVGDFVDCATGEPVELPPVDGVVIDCDNTIQAEEFDSDVRLVGAKNPIPVFQVAQCGDYIRTEDVKLCEVDARFLLLIDSGGVFARYSFITGQWEQVDTLSVASAGGSTDVENYLLYNFVSPDQLTVIDVNTDTQLPNVIVVDGPNINPNVTTNPKTFSAASFRDADGLLYAQDTAGADAGLYSINPATGEVDFVTAITGVSGTGTSIAIDNTTDTLYVNGSNLSYQVDWVTGVATQVANPPIQPNGSTFDTDGNWYVTQGNNTYYLPAGADGNDPANWIQIIDDFTAGANSIAYYEVVAQQPSCFFRRYGILENGDREVIGDFNVTDDSPRTVVGEVDCCECSCGGGEGSGGESAITNFPPTKVEICDGTKTLWQVTNINAQGAETITYEDETGEVPEPADWSIGRCECETFEYWTIEGITEGLRNREWHNTAPSPGTTASTTETGREFRLSHDFSLPTTTDNIQNSLSLNDTDNTPSELDVQVKQGYVIATENTLLRYTNASEGYWAVELGDCCGEYRLLGEIGGASKTLEFTIPKGIHSIRLWNIDIGGTNSAATAQYSNDGLSWTTDDTPPNLIFSQTKPTQVCNQGYLCDDTYYELDRITVVILDDTTSLCKIECEVAPIEEIRQYPITISECRTTAEGINGRRWVGVNSQGSLVGSVPFGQIFTATDQYGLPDHPNNSPDFDGLEDLHMDDNWGIAGASSWNEDIAEGYILIPNGSSIKIRIGGTATESTSVWMGSSPSDAKEVYSHFASSATGDVIYEGVGCGCTYKYIRVYIWEQSTDSSEVDIQWNIDDTGWTQIPLSNLSPDAPSCVEKISWVIEGESVEITGNEYLGSCSCSSSPSGSGSEEAEYTTTFDSEFFTSGFTVPTAPTNTKEVVVFNNSNAWIELDTNYGTQIVPPGGTIEFSVNDYESGITFNSVSIINGSFGGSDNWGINYKTQA